MPKVIRRGRTRKSWSRPKGRVDGRSLWWYARTKAGLLEIMAKPDWGVTLVSLTAQGEKTVFLPPSKKRRRGRDVKKKTKVNSGADVPHLAAVESNVFANLMGLVNHCAITRYDDGDPRKVGWITLKTYGSAWQVEAKDPDTCCRLTVVENSLDNALGLLNMLLESEEAPWEPDQWLQQQAAKNRKKG